MIPAPSTLPVPQTLNPPLHLIAAFDRLFPSVTATWVVRPPGHDAWIAAAPVDSDGFTYTIGCADRGGRAVFSWQSAYWKRTIYQRPLPDWARYPAGVIVDLGATSLDVPGIRAVVMGEATTHPRYEYGLGMAFAALWHEIHGRPYSQDILREIVDRVRREYIGE